MSGRVALGSHMQSPDPDRFSIEQCVRLAKRALAAHGARPDVARSVARALATAEAEGNRICGLIWVEGFCRQLASGRVDGQAQPALSQPRPGVVVVDAQRGFPQPAFDLGLAPAVAACRALGVASLRVRRGHTAAALGYFTERLAAEGVVAIGATNSMAAVAPPGGRRPVLGTNPIAFAAPDGAGGVGLQVDLSTSATALGSVRAAQAAGAPIPEGWAVDAEGRPTTDPAAALAGALAPAGGHRGFGVGLMVELLAAVLTGSTLSADAPPAYDADGPAHDLGQHYLLLDPAATPGEGATAALNRLTDVVVDAGGRAPGQGKAARRAEAAARGVALSPELAARLSRLGDGGL